MSIILFIVILAVLILVHEIGHFVAAKKFGIRVDEFGLGYPPRAIGKKIGETIYSLNYIPFGGFVKIFGENADDNDNPVDVERNFSRKPKWQQAVVLVAGVSFNVLFAWLLISVGFMWGLPTPVEQSPNVTDAHVVITSVKKNSPAEKAGMAVGDTIVSATSSTGAVLSPASVDSLREFIADEKNQTLGINISRGENKIHIEVEPASGLLEDKRAIGVAMDMIGTLRLNPFSALYEGAKTTGSLVYQTVIGLGQFLWQAVTGGASFEDVSGPVGIVGMVGDARTLGFIYLLSFTAFISINLAVINLIPFPALDGGRLLFVIIEKIKGSAIKPVVANTFNTVGFLLLIVLMLVVTYHDIAKLIK